MVSFVQAMAVHAAGDGSNGCRCYQLVDSPLLSHCMHVHGFYRCKALYDLHVIPIKARVKAVVHC